MSSQFRGQLLTAENALRYVLGGHARITAVSARTGTRLTYQITAKFDAEGKIASPHFVALLNGANNERDYSFLGTIFDGRDYRHGRKSRITPDAPSARGFAWIWASLVAGTMPAGCEIWHEGTCSRCGRALTVPESIATGLGPVCAEKA